MPTGKPLGHPIRSPVGSAISYAPHKLGGGIKPLFKALGPGVNGEISTRPSAGTGDATFTRADGATDIAHVRDFENLYKLVPAAEARFQGARRVENIDLFGQDNVGTGTASASGSGTDQVYTVTGLDNSLGNRVEFEWLDSTSVAQKTYTVSFKMKSAADAGQEFRLTFRNGTGGAADTQTTFDIYPETTYNRYYATIAVGADTNTDGLQLRVAGTTNANSCEITEIQLEEVSGQSNQAPSEYVSRDVQFGADLLGGEGEFDDSGFWTLQQTGWSVSGGVASCDGTQAGNTVIDHNGNPFAVTNGKTYEIEYTISNYSAGNLDVLVSGGDYDGPARSANGTYKDQFTAGSTSRYIQLRGDINFVGDVDGVTVREVTTGVKYFYTENNNEVAENREPYSRDFTQWATYGQLPVITKDQIGYDGTTNGACLLEDDDNAAYEAVKTSTYSITATQSITSSVYIKKDSDTSRYPGMYLAVTGGTTQSEYLIFNTVTGDFAESTEVGGGFTYVKVEDKGDWWKVIVSITNNGTNTGAIVALYPALSANGTSFATQAIGSIIADQFQTTFESTHTETQVETTTVAITNVVGTKTAQWEQVDNSAIYSYDCTQWDQSNNTSALDEVGIYGEANTASTVGDEETGSFGSVSDVNTIADDSTWHVITIWCKKDNDTSRAPGLNYVLSGGTTQRQDVNFNTETGTITHRSATGNTAYWTEDGGDWWIWHIAVQNNSSGNTSLSYIFFPAVHTVVDSNGSSTTATGSCIIGHCQVSNRMLPYSGVVVTDGSAITLGKERGLDDQLHPMGVKQNATYFKRFNKWEASTAYSVGDHIIPDTGSGPAGGDGYYYVCVVAGTSAGSEPSFNTTIGDGTYDNGVVWKCLGKATVAGYLAEPARTNTNPNSYDLTAWAQTGTSVSALNETGIDGVANHATTLTDDDGAGFELVVKTFTVGNDSNTHTTSTWIKKDSDTSRFPSVDVLLTGGTGVQHAVDLNTSTGATVSRVSTGTVDSWIEDHGDWWRLVITVTNNTSGNTALTYRIYPAVGTVIGTAAAAATGSCIVGHTQLELNTAVPSSPILTTGASDARAEDTLTYTSPIVSAEDFTLLTSFSGPSYTSTDTTYQFYMVYNGTAVEYPLYQQSGEAYAYDGTTPVTTFPNKTSWEQTNPRLNKVGHRLNNSLDESQVSAIGNTGTSTTALSFSSDQTMRVARFISPATIPILMSDLLFYNKDLGTDSLEALTSYD